MSVLKCNNLYIVFALRRSGHHALIDYIRWNVLEPFHLNNCYMENNQLKWGESHYGTEYEVNKNIPTHIENLIINFEDYDFKNNLKIEDFIQYENKHEIIVVRDFLNWVASRINHDANWVKNYNKEMWINHCEEFLKYDKVPVVYPRLVHEDFYTKVIFKKLGINIQNYPPTVSFHGGGSTFEKRCSVDKIQPLDRYKHLSISMIRESLEDEDILKYTRKIWGERFILQQKLEIADV